MFRMYFQVLCKTNLNLWHFCWKKCILSGGTYVYIEYQVGRLIEAGLWDLVFVGGGATLGGGLHGGGSDPRPDYGLKSKKFPKKVKFLTLVRIKLTGI